jgi:hypothetical protein
LAGECEYEKQKGSWKEFEVVPCLKPVSVLTSVRSFATSVVLVEHIVRGYMRLAVGSQVGGIVEGRPCTASAAFEGT